MIRTFIWFTYFWLYQLAVYPKLLKADRLLSERRLEERDQLIHSTAPRWATSLLKLAGCRVTVEGAEQIPHEGPVLFVANHQSNFDIPILISAIKKPKAFIAKDSLEKMPMVSRWMKHLGCVFMNRENVRQSAVAINQGVALLRQGHSMVIFPEGTRSLDGHLLDFKPGALKLATKAGVPIVPISICGSFDMMKKGSLVIHPSKVTLYIESIIQPEIYETLDTNQLSEQIRATIENRLNTVRSTKG